MRAIVVKFTCEYWKIRIIQIHMRLTTKIIFKDTDFRDCVRSKLKSAALDSVLYFC